MEIQMSHVDYLGHKESIERKEQVQEIRDRHTFEIKQDKVEEKTIEDTEKVKESTTGQKVSEDVKTPEFQHIIVQSSTPAVSTHDLMNSLRNLK